MSPTLRKRATWAVVVASIGVTAILRPGLPHGDRSIGWFVLVFVVANTVNVATMVVASGAVARHAHRNRPRGLLAQVRSFAAMRTWSDDTLRGVADDQVFRVAFGVNAVSATVGALVPGAAIVVLLPPSGWGLLPIVVLDLVGALLLRRAIARRVAAAAASA